jgi:hypothetical protein
MNVESSDLNEYIDEPAEIESVSIVPPEYIEEDNTKKRSS